MEYFRTQRQGAGVVMAVISLILLGVTVFLTIKGMQNPPADKAEEAAKAALKLDQDENSPEGSKPSGGAIKRTDYIIGAIGSLAAFLGIGALAAWLLAGLPDPDEARQRTAAREQVLAFGGILGLLLIASGGVFFYVWSDSLGGWLLKGKEEDALYPLSALLMVVGGAGLVLLCVQPARAEERNNTFIRRLVYGTNLALTTVLLFVVLIVTNVFFSFQVSNKLDTTSSEFYSMSPQTKEFLRSLDQTIVAYAVMAESGNRQESDLRDVLEQFQDESADKFKVKFINPLTNTADLTVLKADFPPVANGERGVLLTFPNDKKRFSFIPFEEFFSSESAGRGETPRRVFIGEGRLVKELLFLADNRQRPKVYFTQAAEELQLVGESEPDKSLSSLKAFLEKNYLDVDPLTFDKDKPKVPDDCAVLVVADPQKPLPANQVEAVRKYMTDPLPGGRKGKLVVLAGATPPAPGSAVRKVTRTGLEELLTQFNVGLKDKYLLGFSGNVKDSPMLPSIGFTVESVRSGNPIARLFKRLDIEMFLPREVDPLKTNPTFTAMPLLGTNTDQGGAWVEDEFPDDLGRSFARARQTGALRPALPVGVLVSEGTVPRVAVYGDGVIFSNALDRQYRGSPPAFDLLLATIDWLRDRPPIPAGVLSKTYAVYSLPAAKTLDMSRLEYLPLCLALLSVGGLGVGVWLTRRRQA